MTPYSGDDLELAVTGTLSGNGARTAGKHGIGLLSLAATTPQGFASIRGQWSEYEKAAAEHGQRADRAKWRCVGPVHLADTKNQARRDVEHGWDHWARYFQHVVPGGLWQGDTTEELLASNDASGTAIIGTPEEALERLKALEEASGGFGTFLIMTSDWANPEATRRSLELFARRVLPHFQGQADAQLRSWS